MINLQIREALKGLLILVLITGCTMISAQETERQKFTVKITSSNLSKSGDLEFSKLIFARVWNSHNLDKYEFITNSKDDTIDIVVKISILTGSNTCYAGTIAILTNKGLNDEGQRELLLGKNTTTIAGSLDEISSSMLSVLAESLK